MNPKILELSRNNAVVRAHISLMERDGDSYEQALERMVIDLADHNQILHNEMYANIAKATVSFTPPTPPAPHHR